MVSASRMQEKKGIKFPFWANPQQIFQQIRDLFPSLTPEISTSKWIKVFMHKIDSKDNQSFHAISSDQREQAKIFAETLRTNNDNPEDICNQHNIKVLSTSLGYSNKNIPSQSGQPFLRISMLIHPALYDLVKDIPPIIDGRETRVKTDSIISKCFVCSKLGHNDTTCKNEQACPFCGENHSLFHCGQFIRDQSLEWNIDAHEVSGRTFTYALCKSDNNETNHNHCGLDSKLSNLQSGKSSKISNWQLEYSQLHGQSF